VRQRTSKGVEGHVPDYTYLVCNPLSGQVLRVPNAGGTTKILGELCMGILTQADRGDGPPDRFAVAQLYSGHNMIRFLSETGKWELVKGAPCQLPRSAAGMAGIYQDTLDFGGRLWWVDVGCGAVTVDPFSDRTEARFVELPKGGGGISYTRRAGAGQVPAHGRQRGEDAGAVRAQLLRSRGLRRRRLDAGAPGGAQPGLGYPCARRRTLPFLTR
jgi:hypothetical protein